MRLQATLLTLVTLVALCSAQLKYTLNFATASPKEIFVASSLPLQPPTQTVKAEGKSIEYAIGAFGGEDRIYVWDHGTNNIASKRVKDIQNVWNVTDGDFTAIGNLTVHVEHGGQPVAAAQVTVKAKNRSIERLVDPSTKGDAQFFGVPAGDLSVKVSYNTADKKQGSQEQVFKLAIKREKADVSFALSIADDVATAAAGSGPAPAKPGQTPATPAGNGAPPAAEGSGAGKLVFVLIAIVIIGILVFLLMRTMKDNPKVFEDKLASLGVQVPKQQDDADLAAAGPVAVPQMAPPPPPQKIVLDDADPTPLGGPVAVATSAPISTGEPAFVGENGSRVLLSEGETVVGREEGLGLSLVGESTVSRRHATAMKRGTNVVLKDLGSTNGTFVNGIRLQGETTLRPGDQVQFGSVRFRYEG